LLTALCRDTKQTNNPDQIVQIIKVDRPLLEKVLPLIAQYQRFYKTKDIDEDLNRRFFSQFIDSHDRGILHAAEAEGEVVGFSTLYFSYSSTLVSPVAVLNDLYVAPEDRRRGIGQALIRNAQEFARNNGYARLQWLTAQDNQDAQKLYDSVSANRSAWYLYMLPVHDG
jgi:ribosomal protein S18 acetylase RimI-like enzyme